MDINVLKSLIEIITKSADKNVIYKALVKLRIDLVKDKDGILLFYKEGGLTPLIRLISKPYEKILEVALSILGNCCTLKDCCKQAISNGIVPPLLTILKSIPNPRVQSRACRLLGNLARESNEKICTLAKGIGVVLASLLEDTKDTLTLTMGIRVVRLLWNEMPFYEEFIRFDGVDKILTILVRCTKVELNTDLPQSIVDQNAFEKERVEFMRKHIQCMERINSRVFDQEILKTTRPMPEDAFQIPVAKDQKELVSEILRCLETITITNVTAYRILYNFYQNKSSITSIICFAKDVSPFRSQSLKILSSLSKSNGKHLFCTSDTDAVTAACSLITARSLEHPLSESEERHCVCIICFLADDACNRSKIRTSGAFKRILDLAKNTTSDALLSMILISLQHFRYDVNSIDLMIRMGLVNVLIERLELKTKDMFEVHNTASGVRNDSSNSDTDDEMESTNPKRPKIDIDAVNFIKAVDASISQASASGCPSPNSSPSSSKNPSPRSFSPMHRKDGTYEDMDDYSPVVSDIEDGNEDEATESSSTSKTKRAQKYDSFNLIDQILNENSSHKDDDVDDNLIEPDEPEEMDIVKEKEPTLACVTEKKKTVNLILSVLCTASARLSHIPYDSSLCTQETLNTLVKACRVAHRQRSHDSTWDAQGAPLVLSHIITERNFVSMLKHDFIFKIYEMARPIAHHDNCTTCKDLKFVGRGLLDLLNKIAETGYGRGEMAHLLLKEDKQMHKQVSIVSAMLIRDPKALNTLLLKHGGLYTLIEMILTKDETLSNEAATGLTALAKQLNIKFPKSNDTKISKTEFILDTSESIDDLKITDENNDHVTFIAGKDLPPTDAADQTMTNPAITNANSVRFSEQILTENSDVFNRMFNSDFKESKDKCVVLKNQSIEGIRYFLECIGQMAVKKPLRKPVNGATTTEKSTKSMAINVINAVLEAYDISQIYMLPELEKNIFNMIVYMLDAANILDVFHFSIRHHKAELTEIAVNYYLTSNIASEMKVNVFRKADDSEYYKEWNDLILDTIVYTCQNLIL